MSNLENSSVKRVRTALAELGAKAEVIELSGTARSAQDAADSIGTELGSIVKTLVFSVSGQAVVALVAGDRRCNTKILPALLGLQGGCKQADADLGSCSAEEFAEFKHLNDRYKANFGFPFISAEQEPHLPALQFQRTAKSACCSC